MYDNNNHYLPLKSQLDREAYRYWIFLLEEQLEGNFYVLLPQGLYVITKRKNKFGLLNRSIYGLGQAARQFQKEFKTYLVKKLNLVQNTTEKCLFKHKSGNMFVGTYVDYLLVIGE